MLRFTYSFLITLLLVPLSSVIVAAQDIPTLWTPKLAVEFALANSPDSQIALERINAAKSSNQLARAGYYPSIGLHATYGQTNNPMYSFGNILNQSQFNNSIDFNDPGRTDNLNLMADIQYRFYNGGRDNASVDATNAYTGSLENEYVAIKNHLAFEVIKAYQSIVQAKDMLKAQEASLGAIQASLDVAKAKFDEGDLLQEELLNLEVQKARASENIIQSNHHMQIGQRTLLNLLGLKDGSIELELDNPEQEIPTQLSYSARPEMAALDRGIDAAEAELRKAKGGNMPTVDGFASYQYDQGYVLDGSGDSWIAGVKLDYALYEGSQTKAKINIAKSKLTQVKRQKAKAELDLNLELEQAKLGYEQAKERLVVTDKMVEVAVESARLSRIRFKEGVILSSNLIDVEMRLNDALVRQSIAKASYKISIANMRRATGLPQF